MQEAMKQTKQEMEESSSDENMFMVCFLTQSPNHQTHLFHKFKLHQLG